MPIFPVVSPLLNFCITELKQRILRKVVKAKNNRIFYVTLKNCYLVVTNSLIIRATVFSDNWAIGVKL